MRSIKSRIHLLVLLSTVLLMLISITGTAYAVEIVDDGNISAAEVIDDDVFIGGNNVVIDGTVNGDLFASGNTITVNGVVNGSLVVAGQNIVVNGKVSGSIYAASSGMTLGKGSQVGRNLYYAGFGLETRSDSTIGRDLLLAGYQGVLSGSVTRDVLAAVAALHLNGEVGGDVKAEVGVPGEGKSMPIPFFTPPGAPAMVAGGLHVGEASSIGGSLTYTSEKNQQGAINSDQIGEIVYQTPVPGQGVSQTQPKVSVELGVGRWILARLRELATLLVLGGLALWLIPTHLSKWVDKVKAEPLSSAGWGFITIIVGYLAAFFIAISIITLAVFLGVITLGGLAQTVLGAGFSSLGLAFTVFSLFVSYGSKLIVSYLAGRLIFEKFFPQQAGHKVWPLLLGVGIYVVIRSIPFLGWLVGVAVTMIGIGSIWLVFREQRLAPTASPA